MTITESNNVTIGSESASVTIPRDILRAAVTVADVTRSTDNARPLITGAQLTLSNCELIIASTDSYTLSTYHANVECADFGPVIISGGGIKAMIQALKPKALSGDGDTLTLFDGSLTLDTGAAVVNIGTENGTYPDWRQLIPSAGISETEAIAFNPTFLARMEKIAKALQTSKRVIANEYFAKLVAMNGATRPALWQIEGALGTAQFLIMPLRINA